MRSAPRHQDALDRGFALLARLASSQIDAMLHLEEPALSVGVHIIGDGGTAQPNRMSQDLAQRFATGLLGDRYAVRPAPRTDSCMK